MILRPSGRPATATGIWPLPQQTMKQYIGTKVLLAQPMTRGEYNAYRGWTPPEGEDQTVPGYLVEYQDGGKANDERHKGYISWSPGDVFERAYRETSALSFGDAIAALKAGKRVCRAGWEGKGLFVFMQVPARIPANIVPNMQSLPDSVKAELGRRGQDLRYSNQMALVKPDSRINGWAPSAGDALAEDWMVLEADEPPMKPPHQQRVIDEREELVVRLRKLGSFIKESPVFKTLPAEERERLVRQESCMSEYSLILGERIRAF